MRLFFKFCSNFFVLFVTGNFGMMIGGWIPRVYYWFGQKEMGNMCWESCSELWGESCVLMGLFY